MAEGRVITQHRLMGLLKNILIFVGIGVALLAMRMYQVAGGSSRGGMQSDGFVEVPRPSNAPAGKVLLIGPENCPKEAGRRIDSLQRAVSAAGIPCVRLHSVSISPSSQSEADRVNKVMSGDLPVVFVGGFAKNNPTLDEIKTQLLSARK